jgi:hypothetical protein
VVKKPEAQVSVKNCWRFYEGKTAKWQIPDDVVFVDAIANGRYRQDLEDSAARIAQGLPPAGTLIRCVGSASPQARG